MIKVIAIVGPTAVGKTALSIELAKKLNGEIISGDSMQIYRNLNIGTAKVTQAEMDGVVHHLIDIKNPDERYSVAEFQEAAKKLIKEIHGRGKLPIIAGGTGFYLQALTDNLTLGNDEFDEASIAIRAKWQEFYQVHGKQPLWDQLQQRDPVSAAQINLNNTRRVIRALEVIEKTGKLFSQQPTTTTEFDFKLVGLTTDRKLLYERINQRVDVMMQQGLLDEVKWLNEVAGPDSPAAKGICYHELFPYLAHQLELQTAVENIKKDSRHYAKRQLTWFRNKMDVQWFDLIQGQQSSTDVISNIEKWLKS